MSAASLCRQHRLERKYQKDHPNRKSPNQVALENRGREDRQRMERLNAYLYQDDNGVEGAYQQMIRMLAKEAEKQEE